MYAVQLKLKQASAVLGAAPKDLQNLAQFGVVKPKRRAGVFLFDTSVLCTARVALFLKDAFGTKTGILSQYTDALAEGMDDFWDWKPDFVIFTSRFPREEVAVQLKVPFRKIAEELEERLGQLPLFRDLPRGRKRPGWKKEFLASLREAAQDLAQVSEKEILDAVRQYRRERKPRPEVTVVAEA